MNLFITKPALHQCLINSVTGQVKSDQIHMSGNATYQAVASDRGVRYDFR